MDDADRQHIQLLLEVARAYYWEEQSQEEIAAAIGYSRSSVSRLISQARERRVVRFVIDHPLERQLALESKLVQRFGLRSVRVADMDRDISPFSAVARAGAEALVEACRESTVLATSAGETIDAVIDHLPSQSRADLHVVQMIGALARGNPLVDTPEITRRLAMRLGADHRQMHAPLLVGSARLATALKREEAVANALVLAARADVALIGVGAVSEQGVSSPILQGWISPRERQTLIDHGAVGHMCGHHFDIEGRHIVTEVCDRVIAVPLEGLRQIPTVVAVAAGPDKVAAIRGAIRGGYLDQLVTDATTAAAVLALDAEITSRAGVI